MSPPEPSSRRRSFRGARWLTLLGTSVLLLVGVELGLRVFLNYDSQWNLRVGAGKEFDPVTQFRNKPHFSYYGGAVTNDRGYFAPDNLQLENPSDRFRIIFMGDSVSFLPTSNNHPIQLERKLNERGYSVERLNAAVPGFASHNVRAMFESEISEYDADLFILLVGWNDLGQFGPEGLPYKRHGAGYEVSPIQQFIANIYLVRVTYAIQRFFRRFEPAFDAPLSSADERLYDEYYPQHFYENVSATLKLARERYPRVFVVNLLTITSDDPTQHQLDTAHFPIGMDKNMRKLHRVVLRYNETIARVGQELGVPVVDLYSAFESEAAKQLLTDSCHVRKAGAELIASTVFEKIEASLPQPSEG